MNPATVGFKSPRMRGLAVKNPMTVGFYIAANARLKEVISSCSTAPTSVGAFYFVDKYQSYICKKNLPQVAFSLLAIAVGSFVDSSRGERRIGL